MIAITTSTLGISFSTASDDVNKTSFHRDEWRDFPVIGITQHNHNTKIFRIHLPSADHEMGMDVASCIVVKGVGRDGKTYVRPFTPITTNNVRGHFDILVKNYPLGNVSSYLHGIHVGEKISVKGPYLKFAYTPNMKQHVAMIAGGSGITPMLQVMREITNNPADTTQVHLIFCNKSVEDILMRNELERISRQHKNIHIHHVVDIAPTGPNSSFDGTAGHIDKDLIKRLIPAAGSNILVCVCGPPGFMEAVSGDKAKDKSQGPIGGMLKELGYQDSEVFKF